MVGEVNKIIYNMLISGRGVLLPQIGILYIERQGARKIAEDRLLGPRNVVAFSSHEQAPSLIDEIVSIAGCGADQAEDIYERWKAKTLNEGVLTISGIGQLKGKSFVMEPSFNQAINPKGVKTLVVRRRARGGWLYALAAVCVVIALGFMAYIMWGGALSDKGTKPATQSEQVETAQTLAVESVAEQDSTSLASAQSTPVQTGAATSQTQPSTTQLQSAQSAQSVAQPQNGAFSFYVVMGVFSTEANAARAVEQVQSKVSDLKCEVRPFGSKFMVTLFGSNSREECNTFARSYRDIYPDLWVYNKK